MNILRLPVNVWKKSCPWTLKVPVNSQKSARETQICPWTFSKKSVREPMKTAREHLNFVFFVTFCEKVSVNCEKCPWKFPKKCPWTHPKVPVKTSKKVPVNTPSNPWTFTKKCPWTQKSTREHRPKNGVHGHFWCSRGKKKHWITYACTYKYNQIFHQYSYGFQNLMSSFKIWCQVGGRGQKFQN